MPTAAKTRVGVGLAVLAAAAVSVVSLLAFARGGSESATGRVISVETVATGTVVCVRDDDSGRIRCGEVVEADLPDRLGSVEVGDCAYIKVGRGAALKFERRPCA